MWDVFAADRPDVAQAALLAHELLRAPDTTDDSAFYVNLGMAARAATIAAEPAMPRHGIYGTGAWLVANAVVPAAFVQPGLAPRGGSRFSRSSVRHLVPERSRRGLAAVYVVPLPPPVALLTTVAPGAPITIGMRHATAGVAVVVEPGGVTGFVTAGHAAPDLGAVVRNSDGDAVGSVAKTVHMGAGAAGASPDIALVDMSGFAVKGDRRVLQSRSARQRDVIVMHGQRGPVQSWIRGLCPEFALGQDSPGWGDVALTATAMSVPGDSGAPVLGDDGRVLGHVVGGTPAAYSVVQDLEYQLDAIGARLAP